MPTGPQPDPEQDEFQDCCDETQAALANLANLISQLSAGGSGQVDCCASVVAAIASVTTALAAIAKLLPGAGGGGTPIDLTPIVNALNAIAAEEAKVVAEFGKPLEVTLTNPPADITINSPPTDLTALVAQLAKLTKIIDVKPETIAYLVDQGFISRELAQVVQSADLGDWLVSTFRTYGWDALTWALSLVGITYTGGKFHFSIASLRAAVAGDVEHAISDSLAVGSWPLTPVVKGLIDGITDQLQPTRPVAIGDSGVDTATLVAKTLTPALIVNLVTIGLGYLGWNTSEQLTKYVEIISTLTGLEEIKEMEVGELMRAGPIAAARLRAQHLYRQNLPGVGQAASWAARGLISLTQADQLLAFNGLSAQYAPPTLAGAYSGISARQLIRLFATGLFTQADITDELTFAGMRPASQHRFQLVAPYLATNPERTQLRSQLEAQYEAGLMTDGELTGAIDSAEQNTNRDSLILDRVHSREQVTIAKALEAEYTTMYIAGLIDHATYTGNLSGMGLQQWKVDALAGVADAHRAATLARQMAAEERALVRATAAKERQAAMQGFADGVLNQPALLGALIATGLNAVQAAAWTTLATLKKAGALRWIYGLQLQPAQATLLKARITALVDQRKKSLLSETQFFNELQNQGIPDLWINALRTATEAEIAGKGKQNFIHVFYGATPGGP